MKRQHIQLLSNLKYLLIAIIGLIITMNLMVLSSPNNSELFKSDFKLIENKFDSGSALNPNLTNGKMLFRNHCASCHSRDMKTDLIGPALGGVNFRWSDFPGEDLYMWIRNSQRMISDGHPRAKVLWTEWKRIMNSFPKLTDQEIQSILDYVEFKFDNN